MLMVLSFLFSTILAARLIRSDSDQIKEKIDLVRISVGAEPFGAEWRIMGVKLPFSLP